MFKKVMALVLGLSMMLSIAACGKKVEVPSKGDVKKAAAEEYDMEFKVDSEDVSDDEKEAEWVLISKDGTLEVTVTWNAKNPDEFEFDDKESARRWFQELRQKFIDWNYEAQDGDGFRKLEEALDAQIQERIKNA